MNDPRQMTLNIESSAFRQGENIPSRFTCDGANISPALSWEPPPAKTQSLALIVNDPDAPSGTFVHWILYNLPASARSLPEGIAKQEQLPDGSQQGTNGFDGIGYGGPCPPPGPPHRYFFTLYALDSRLAVPPGASGKQLTKAMEGHIVAAGQLMGRYHR